MEMIGGDGPPRGLDTVGRDLGRGPAPGHQVALQIYFCKRSPSWELTGQWDKGSRGSTSLPQFSPGPLGRGLALEVLSRAGTLHFKTPPRPPVPTLSLWTLWPFLCRAGVTTLFICCPLPGSVCPRSDLWVPFCPVPAGVTGVYLSWPRTFAQALPAASFPCLFWLARFQGLISQV